MWIYRENPDYTGYQVGYQELHSEKNMPSYSVFVEVEKYLDQQQARKAVHFLNGGSGQVEVSGTVDIGTTGL